MIVVCTRLIVFMRPFLFRRFERAWFSVNNLCVFCLDYRYLEPNGTSQSQFTCGTAGTRLFYFDPLLRTSSPLLEASVCDK